jgi:hypothetical protein
MRDFKTKYRIKNETTDEKNEKFELDHYSKNATTDEKLDIFADIIVALLLKEYYENKNEN